MSYFKNYSFAFVVLWIISIGCENQKVIESTSKYEKVVTKYTSVQQIISKEVNDTFYVLIRLPKNYVNTKKRYPVLYLLDGDISFNMATSIVRYLQYGKDLPELIIAAPAYGTMFNDSEVNFRERDYSFSNIERFPNSGGGNKYLSFFEKELIPVIDSTYRTTEERILSGYSLGGLFAVNVLIRKPELFSGYIAGSPYIINDIDYLIKQLKKSSFTNFTPKLFLSVGELEERDLYHKPIKLLFNTLKDREDIKTFLTEFKRGTHFTCPAEALTYGLKYQFEE